MDLRALNETDCENQQPGITWPGSSQARCSMGSQAVQEVLLLRKCEVCVWKDHEQHTDKYEASWLCSCAAPCWVTWTMTTCEEGLKPRREGSSCGWNCSLSCQPLCQPCALLIAEGLPGAPPTLAVSSGHQRLHRVYWRTVVPSRILPHLPYLSY